MFSRKRSRLLELEATTLNIPNLILEELRCYLCEGYLSCSPVRVLPNGRCICGSCSPLAGSTPVYRVLPLEAILRNTSFPCQFMEYGCTENVLFSKAAAHQNKCAYRPIQCPSLIRCMWKGLPSKLYNHFNKRHEYLIKEKAEFNFHVGQNTQGVLMTVEDSFVFIIKYIYNMYTTNLKYDIRFCTSKVGYDLFFKSQLTNLSDTERVVSLKMNKCCLYDESFYEMQAAKTLNINKFMPTLGDPDFMAVILKPKIVKAYNAKEELENNLEVNFDLIKSLKCHICNNYLVPPLFDLDGFAVCGDCGKTNDDCTPSKDADLLKRMKDAVYPCRWNECDFVATSGNFKSHEKVCPFLLYKCIYLCKDTFKLPELINHLQATHKIDHSDKAEYKTSFIKNYDWKNIFTIKESVPVLIQHKMWGGGGLPPLPGTHEIKLFSSPGGSTPITGTVQFEHQHCKLKSQEFVIHKDDTKYISFQQLLPCFDKTDELTVIVKLNIK